MTDDVRLLGDRQFSVAAVEPNRAAAPGEMNPAIALSNVVLPDAVGASEHERLAGRDRERQPVDNAAPAALYDQVFSNKLHRDEISANG